MSAAQKTVLLRGGSAKFPVSPNPLVLGSKIFRPGGTIGGSNITLHGLGYCEAPFTAVRVGIVNTLVTSYASDAICVAPTSVVNDNINPLDAGGSAQAWTVASSGVVASSPAATSGTTGVPNIAWSNWIPVNSITRTDNAAYPHLVMARIHFPTGNIMSGFAPASTECSNYGLISPAGARPQIGYFKSGNFVASNQAGFTTPTLQFFPFIFEFQTAVAGKTVLMFGDSIEQGAGSTSHYGCFGQLACNSLSTLSAPVQFVNSGFQGMTTAQSFATAEAYINAFSPQTVVIAPYSINDTQSQAQADTDFTRAMTFAAKVKRSGMTPVLLTGIPSISLSVQSDGFRQGLNTKIKAQSLYAVADIDAAVTNGATPARLQAGFDSGDGVHPNDAGNAAMATVLAAVI